MQAGRAWLLNLLNDGAGEFLTSNGNNGPETALDKFVANKHCFREVVMSVVFNEGANMSDQSASRHKLRRCADCGGMFVDRNEFSKNCGNCRNQGMRHAEVRPEERPVGRASVGTTTSPEKPWVTPPSKYVPGDSSREDSSRPDVSCPPELPASKTQWRTPPFKIQFEETSEAEATDKFTAALPPKRFAGISNKAVLMLLAMLVCSGLLIARYGIPDFVRQLAQRAFAPSPGPVEQHPFPPGSARRSTY